MKPFTLILTIVLAVSAFALIGQDTFAADDKEKDSQITTPADRVAVMYFHRTKRCPTCRKIGTYVNESVKEKFAEQMKSKTVGLYYVDFQQKKNEKLAKAYKVTGPTLVMVKIVDNKMADWKPMPKIWKLVGDKEKFFEYVQTGVEEYQDPPATDKNDDKKESE